MITRVKTLVETFHELNTHKPFQDIEIGELCEYNVKKWWFSEMESQIPQADQNGIYIYTDMNEAVLYIGKGEYHSKGGIGYRSCAHLGSVNKDSEEMFLNHQWIDDPVVNLGIKELIGKGNFLIWTLPIDPDYFISLAEVFLQTIYRQLNDKNPPLNKKIG